MKKTEKILIAAAVLALAVVMTISAAAFAEGPQNNTPQGAAQTDRQPMGENGAMRDGRQGGFGRGQQRGGPQDGFCANDGQQPERPEGDEGRTPPADGENGPAGRSRDPMRQVLAAVEALEDEEAKANIEALMQAYCDAVDAQRNAEDDEARAAAAEAVTAARDALHDALTEAGIELPAGGPKNGRQKPEKPEENELPADGPQAPEQPEGDLDPADRPEPPASPEGTVPEQDGAGMEELFQQFLEWMENNKG